ncbi:MAG: hypothetical protein ACI8YQ_004147 [Polaribacter sp.]|jgi:hypothetical protein
MKIAILERGNELCEQGILSYYIKVRNINGEFFEIEERVCSYKCSGKFPIENLSNCAFGVQHDGEGGFDENKSTYKKCF